MPKIFPESKGEKQQAVVVCYMILSVPRGRGGDILKSLVNRSCLTQEGKIQNVLMTSICTFHLPNSRSGVASCGLMMVLLILMWLCLRCLRVFLDERPALVFFQ